MRHLKATKKFGRTSAHRLAMWRNMTTSLILHERIRTTDEKAKQLRGHVAKMITLAKKSRALGDGTADKDIAAKQLHYRRQALAFVRDKQAVSKLFSDLAERFEERAGGYTRIIKVGNRRGDGAKVSIIELLGAEEEVVEKKTKKKSTKGKKTGAKKTTKKAKPAVEEAVTEEAVTGEAVVEEVVTEEAVTEETVAEETAPETETEAEEAEEGESVSEEAAEDETPEAEEEENKPE